MVISLDKTYLLVLGVLLMVGTFQSLDIKVNAMSLVLASIPVAIITLILVWIKNILLDRYFNKNMEIMR